MARVEMKPMKKEEGSFNVKVRDEGTPNATERTHRSPVIQAKKKSASVFEVFKEAFIMEGEEPFAHFLAKEIAYGLKDAIVEIVNSGMTNAFYGNKYDGRYRDRYDRYDRRGYSHYDYSRSYRYDDRDRRGRDRRDDRYDDRGPRRANPVKFEQVECETVAEAQKVLEQCRDLLLGGGLVSVADLYEFSGITTTPEENNFGWDREAFSEVEIVKTKYNTYIIDLPSPISLQGV